MYSCLVDGNSQHKKTKGVNRNVVATISHNKQKDVLVNKKCFRDSMNRIQSKIIKLEHMKSTRFLCLAFMIKYTSQTMDVTDQRLVTKVNHKKTVILITILKKSFLSSKLFYVFLQSEQLFCKAISFNFQSNQESVFIQQTKLKKRKSLKTSEVLMLVLWHPNRWQDWNV